MCELEPFDGAETDVILEVIKTLEGYPYNSRGKVVPPTFNEFFSTNLVGRVRRFAEAIKLGLCGDFKSTDELFPVVTINGVLGKYGKTALLAHRAIPPFFRNCKNPLDLRRGEFLPFDVSLSRILTLSGESLVYLLNENWVLKITRLSTMTNFGGIEVVTRWNKIMESLHFQLFPYVIIPPAHYLVLRDPRTNLALPAALQQYVPNLHDVFLMDREFVNTLDPKIKEYLRRLLNDLTEMVNLGYVPDILGENNFAFSPKFGLVCIDPLGFYKSGVCKETDKRVEERLNRLRALLDS